jgi:hypothetical protein
MYDIEKTAFLEELAKVANCQYKIGGSNSNSDSRKGVGLEQTAVASHFWLAGCRWLLSYPRQPIGSKYT